MKEKENNWIWDAQLYHIYPLGLTGAAKQNNFKGSPSNRLGIIKDWTSHIRALGCNALYLGPVFESGTHGYDTADYYTVDRRLGTNETLKELSAHLNTKGIRLILDGVFHHVGREFWAFRDLQAKGPDSPYRHWFSGVDFNRSSPYGDTFAYDGWNGHHNLVKLNLQHPDVRSHLFSAVQLWIEEFGIDGLRLDAADVMDLEFQRDLARFCRGLKPDFCLIGEVIHGDYRRWIGEGGLDSTTNYECYKGLYSSHNDGNYFEIAHSLNRLFGEQGIYRGLPLYSFVDNHDVNRIASTLHNSAHLYPVHALLYIMPGLPSIYYGSEWGIQGRKRHDSDDPLRPMLSSPAVASQMPHPDLAHVISRFAKIRHHHAALRHGTYQQLHVSSQQLAFARSTKEEHIIVVVNADSRPANLQLPARLADGCSLTDLLDPQYSCTVKGGKLHLDTIPACWARILRVT